MKNKFYFLLAVLFVSISGIKSQNSLSNVWDLLLKNKREEAKSLFDKNFASKKNSDIDLFITDIILQSENGKIMFGDEGIEDFVKFPNSNLYLFPMYNHNMFDFSSESSNCEVKFQALDKLFQDEKFKNDEIVKLIKLKSDNYRRIKSNLSDDINSINNWQVCGVFENLNKSGLSTVYEPENYPKNDKMFNARNNGWVNWYVNPNKLNKKGYFYLDNESLYGSGIVYSQVFVESPIDQRVRLNFGYKNNIKVFLNDVEIYMDDEAHSNYPSSNIFEVNLSKGNNRLLVKYEVQSYSNNYFLFNFTDNNGKKIENLVYHNSYKEYPKSTAESINKVKIDPAYEVYFKSTLPSSPNYWLHQYLLTLCYSNNGKVNEMLSTLNNFDKSYENSSIINVLKKVYYTYTDQSEIVDEIDKKMENQDSFYYMNYAADFLKSNTLISDEKSKIEKKQKESKRFIDPIFNHFYNLVLVIKDNKKDLMTAHADSFLKYSLYNHSVQIPFARLYKSIDNDDTRFLKVIRDIYKDYENPSALSIIKSEFEDEKKYDSIRKIHEYLVGLYPEDNGEINDYIDFLIEKNDYTTALKMTDKLLENYPYSFKAMETKAEIYKQLKQKDSVIFWYKKALSYYPESSSLHEKYYDYIEHKNEIDEVRTKNIYDYIKANRGKGAKSDKGVNTILDEYIVNVYDERVCKSKSYLIYEITSEKGLEELKEIDRSGGFDYIKSELIKPNGTILPIENSGNVFVPTNLQVNDVILLESEDFSSNSGRFYRDVTKWNYFVGSYPCNVSRFGIIYPEDMKFQSVQMNGNAPMTTKKLGKKNYTLWEAKNLSEMPEAEDYSPKYNDRVHCVVLSTIDNWGEIANWYLDLIGNNLKLEHEALDAYNQLFPNGAQVYDEESRARKIYYYITKNMNYSSIDFRQSNYVPQKPAKTVRTKLGDCKDLSSLFVAMATKAGLDAKMVLVLTADNGTNYIQMPEIAFNHMIVKTKINGVERFLELTNKEAGYQVYHSGNQNAIGLVINQDKKENENAKLIHINQDYTSEKLEIKVRYEINDNNKVLKTTMTGYGNNTYLHETFYNGNSESAIKKSMEELFGESLGKPVVFKSYSNLTQDTVLNKISVDLDLLVNEKTQSVGSMKLVELPLFIKPYSVNVVKNETRKYDIIYPYYETTHIYNFDLDIAIAEGKKFVEIPENKEFTYKNHKFNLTYTPVNSNTLNVKLFTQTSLDNVTKEEYPEFKKYVENVLDKLKDVVGFK